MRLGHDADRPAVGERSFGLTVGGILAALAGIRLGLAAIDAWPPRVDALSAVLLAVASALLVLALVRPSWLAVPNRLWFQLGLLLSRIVNPVVMLLFYAVCIVPIGIPMRLFGYDPLLLKRDPKAQTYWVEYEQPSLDEPMRHQF